MKLRPGMDVMVDGQQYVLSRLKNGLATIGLACGRSSCVKIGCERCPGAATPTKSG